MGKRSLKEWLYGQSPRLVTATGYVFGLAILAGAASTWFVQTPVSARAAGVLQPEAEAYAFPTKALVLQCRVAAGQTVAAGDLLAHAVTAPEHVANYELATELRAQAARAEALGDAAGANRYRSMLELMPAETPTEEVKARTAGWVTGLAAVTEENELPPNTPLLYLANDDTVRIETTLTPDRMPSLSAGDEARVLVPGWDSHPFRTTVERMTLTAEFAAPTTDFSAEELAALEALPADLAVVVADRPFPAQVAREGEEVVFRLRMSDGPGEERPAVKTGQRLSATLDGLNSKKLSSRWSRFPTELVLRAPRESLPGPLRQAVRQHMEQGGRELPLDDIWVETGHCRLFSRLFSK